MLHSFCVLLNEKDWWLFKQETHTIGRNEFSTHVQVGRGPRADQGEILVGLKTPWFPPGGRDGLGEGALGPSA